MRFQSRKPTIIDGMILIGATAVGLGLARATWSGFHHGLLGLVGFVVAAIYGMLAPWASALLVIRLRRPRPPRRRLGRQPGYIACAASVLALVITLATTLPFFPALSAFAPQMLFGLVLSPGIPVAAAWL